MAADEELKAVYNIFTDVWRLYKKFADVRPDDEYWDAVVKEAGTITQKYNSELCKDLIFAVLDELDRKGRAQREAI